MSENTIEPFGELLSPRLDAWIEDQPGIPGTGPIRRIQSLSGGSQNHLFLFDRDGGRAVLRRPSLAAGERGSAVMAREARLLKALAGTAVPHAALFASCEDTSIIGAGFYVMEPLDGFSPLAQLPEPYASKPDWRRAMGIELTKAAAALAAIDWQKAGLQNYGKPDEWHARQAERWRGQLESYLKLPGYEGTDLPHLERVAQWLDDNLPEDRRMGIIHGDYQFPNIMFRYDKPVIAGLIDWELSALGDPMLDFGWLLASWWDDKDPAGKMPACAPWDGFATRDEMIDIYLQETGRSRDALPWFVVLACYKLASILEGSYARSKAGLMPIDLGLQLREHAYWLMAKANSVIETGRI